MVGGGATSFAARRRYSIIAGREGASIGENSAPVAKRMRAVQPDFLSRLKVLEANTVTAKLECGNRLGAGPRVLRT